MTKEHILRDESARRALEERLVACPEVTEHDEEEGLGGGEARTLTVAFSDMEGSFRKILDEQLPALTGTELSPAEIESCTGESARHR